MEYDDLISEICAEALLSNRDCRYLMRVIQTHFRHMANNYSNFPGKRSNLKLKNFGSFERTFLQTRAYQLPEQTGPHIAPAHFKITYRPSLLMKEIANGIKPIP